MSQIPAIDPTQFTGDFFLAAPGRMNEGEFDRWTWANPGIRAEWVAGEVILISPVRCEHDDLFHWLSRFLGNFVEDRGLGTLKGPEFTVRLGPQNQRRLPDLLFVATNRRNLLTETYLDGPPDLALEIVSPDSQARDWREKYLDYERAGVAEYWIVDPSSKVVEAYALTEGRYARIEPVDGKIASRVVPGWFLRPQMLWASPRPRVSEALREIEGS